MAQSIIMSIATVSDFKKYLKECLKTSKVDESNYDDNVLINLAHDWLGEHYSSKTEKFNYHVILCGLRLESCCRPTSREILHQRILLQLH